MKTKDLKRRLTDLGWTLIREGGNHEVWGNGKGQQTAVPRHRETNELTAKAIIKNAENFPG